LIKLGIINNRPIISNFNILVCFIIISVLSSGKSSFFIKIKYIVLKINKKIIILICSFLSIFSVPISKKRLNKPDVIHIIVKILLIVNNLFNFIFVMEIVFNKINKYIVVNIPFIIISYFIFLLVVPCYILLLSWIIQK